MQKLSNTITTENITTNAKNSAILRTKYDLGEICHDKALQYLDMKDKNISKIYSKTYQIHREIINDYERLYTALSNKYQNNKTEYNKLQKEVQLLTKEVQNHKIERAALLDASENLEKLYITKDVELQRSQNDYKQEIITLKEELKQTHKENDILLEKLIKFTKEKTSKILENSPFKEELKSTSRVEAIDENIKKKL